MNVQHVIFIYSFYRRHAEGRGCGGERGGEDRSIDRFDESKYEWK